MQGRCPKCGNFVASDERFCTKCGENLDGVHTDAQNYYNQYQNSYNNTYAPMANTDSDMTFGQWFVTVLVTNIFGIISWIFLFIWGFGSGPESRKKYCKAMLIVKAIALGISLIFTLIYIGIFSHIFSEVFDQYYDKYYDSGYSSDYDYDQDYDIIMYESDT